MGKVYAVQERKRYNVMTEKLESIVNISPATEYGEVEILLDHKQTCLLPAPIIKQLKEKLRHFSDDDYILPIGDPILIGIATAIAAKNNMGRVKMLYWDKDIKKYIRIEYETK